MKRIILFCFILVSVIFTSCKKKSNTTATVTNTTPQPFGELTANRIYIYNTSGTLIGTINSGYASLRTDITSISSVIQVGGVWANGTKFKHQSGSPNYIDSTSNLTIVPTTWQVMGAGTIPSFTYTNNDSLPGYTDLAALPDTIDKSQNLNLQINGVSGAPGLVNVSFYNSAVSASNLSQQKSSGISANNIFTFSAATLSSLPIGTSSPTTLIVTIIKTNVQTISGVTFHFDNELEINKTVYIK